jgi:hypothetical protein
MYLHPLYSDWLTETLPSCPLFLADSPPIAQAPSTSFFVPQNHAMPKTANERSTLRTTWISGYLGGWKARMGSPSAMCRMAMDA